MTRADGDQGDAVAIRRRFVRVDGRGVHYLRAGEGPPVVLLHSSIRSGSAEIPLITRLASDHTVLSFDHPGYGDSDVLSRAKIEVADAADALKATLDQLGISRCPVYGSHTGGQVALEFARLHPERVALLVMDGVTLFDERETELFLNDQYLPPAEVKGDGSHLFVTWMQVRDSYMWFPWNKVTAAYRQCDWPLPPVDAIHRSLLDRLLTGDSYQFLYSANFRLDTRASIQALTVPAVFMVEAFDPLFPHHDRLGELGDGQEARRYPGGRDAYWDEVAAVLRAHRLDADAPAEGPFVPTPKAINRRYVDLRGGQVLVRSAAEERDGRPLLLLHDGRSSSRMFEPVMHALGRRRPVYAIDLPGCGASDPLDAEQPAVGDYAAVAVEACKTLGSGECDVYAVGAGAAVAVSLLGEPEFAAARTVLEAPDFYGASFAERLASEWVPDLTPDMDGAYLTRVWLMLRDEYAFWPWFDKSLEGACAVPDPDWGELHARTVEVLRSLATYNRLTRAALGFDWSGAMSRLVDRAVVFAAMESEPRRPHVEAAAEAVGSGGAMVLPSNPVEKAERILDLLATGERK